MAKKPTQKKVADGETVDPLDATIRKMSADILRLRLSADKEREELREMLRILREEREREQWIKSNWFRPYPEVPLWIEPSQHAPFANPSCDGLLV